MAPARMRKSIPTTSPNSQLLSFADIQFLATGVYKIKLTLRVLLMQQAIMLHGDAAIEAGFDDGYPLKVSLVIGGGVCF